MSHLKSKIQIINPNSVSTVKLQTGGRATYQAGRSYFIDTHDNNIII